jgi:hypothetical protein
MRALASVRVLAQAQVMEQAPEQAPGLVRESAQLPERALGRYLRRRTSASTHQ